MARQINRLTPPAVRALSEPGKYADGNGLYLVIDANGRKRWVAFIAWKGKRREMGLGTTQSVSLAKARDLARTAREKARDGTDPIAERSADHSVPASIPTLKQVADATIEALSDGWRSPKTGAHWKCSFETHARAIASKPVDQITTEDVLSVLKPIWATKPETAKNLRIRIERVLDAARVQGWRNTDNPARWRGHLAHILPKPQKLSRGHFPSMPFEDLPSFMAQLADNQSMSARALEWTILTASRESMTLSATWEEIDIKNAVWTIPPNRMKAGKAHRIPLSSQAQSLLEQISATNLGPDALLFPSASGHKPMSDMAMDMLLRRLAPGYVPHGFRSTFRDWAGETTDHPREIAEAALAHSIGNETERAYRRGDALQKRRLLMQDWGDYCCSAQ